MKSISIFLICFSVSTGVFAQNAAEILDKIDKNMSSKSRILESTITIHGKRNDRTLTSKSYTEGDKKSFTEYLSPARDKGTKMLKLDKELWVYSPSTDRIIMISGHMLRQSVMGSDLSYEDMMDDRKLQDIYISVISGEETIDGRKCYVLKLTAKVDDVAYHSQTMLVDKERFIPLKQELFAKSGQLLKRITMSDIKKIGTHWFPMKMNYKDMLKEGNGTDWIVNSIEFDKTIPQHIFSKAGLKQ